MSSTFEKIRQTFKEIFPDFDATQIRPDMVLGDLPDWDSLAAVNFQSYMEQEFSLVVPLDILHEDLPIDELADVLDHPDKMQMAS